MTADRESLRIITGWLINLSQLVRHGEQKPTKDQIALYATMLAEELPSGAFTQRSLLHAATGMTWWPDFSSLRGAAMAWWSANRPTTAPRLTGPAGAGLTWLDQSWLDFYQKRRAEITAPGYVPDRGSVTADLASLASLLREQSRPAYNIAFDVSWPTDGHKPSEDEIARVSATVAAGLQFPSQPTSRPFELPSARPPAAHLPRETIDAMRAARASPMSATVPPLTGTEQSGIRVSADETVTRLQESARLNVR